MTEQNLPFFKRLSLAFAAFFRTISDPQTASAIDRQLHGPGPSGPAQAPRPKPSAAAAPTFTAPPPDAALQLLGLLQQDGRLIDFLEEDVSAFSDAEIGAAARVVHEGCRKAVREHFSIVPLRAETEGARVTLQEGFDPSAIRLTGNVVGKAPFTGNLVHRGWRAADVKLPRVANTHDTRILAPAEVEL
jgi:hypothetical protein